MTKTAKKFTGLKAINDIYIIEEDPIETSYDTGVSAEVTEALKEGKLIIPDKYKDFAEKFPYKGVIISKGDKCVRTELKIGSRVMFPRIGPMRYEFEGKTFVNIKEQDIHGTLES